MQGVHRLATREQPHTFPPTPSLQLAPLRHPARPPHPPFCPFTNPLYPLSTMSRPSALASVSATVPARSTRMRAWRSRRWTSPLSLPRPRVWLAPSPWWRSPPPPVMATTRSAPSRKRNRSRFISTNAGAAATTAARKMKESSAALWRSYNAGSAPSRFRRKVLAQSNTKAVLL